LSEPTDALPAAGETGFYSLYFTGCLAGQVELQYEDTQIELSTDAAFSTIITKDVTGRKLYTYSMCELSLYLQKVWCAASFFGP
jgi:hypothetical protein